MGGLSRRFLNVIVDNRAAGVQTLRCIDLLPRHKLLFNTKPPSNKQAAAMTKMVPLASPPRPSPCSSMRASTTSHEGIGMHCCLDRRSGRSVLLEADTSRLVMVPCLHQPKLDPISLYVPDRAAAAERPERELLDGNGNPAPFDHADGAAGTFFLMDRIGRPKEGNDAAASCQSFEALVSRDPYRGVYPAKFWECDRLPPPPPYIDGSRRHSCLEITSHAVTNDNTICVSIGGVGTYCFDKVTYEWCEVGKWTLPFRGKVEYVPDLNLWFGFSSEDGQFAAADISTMDMSMEDSRQPQLLDSWKELEPPQGWQQIQDPQLVSLGSGRFCITRFFHTGTETGSGDESIPCCQSNTTVLTGVEVTAHGVNEQVNLGIFKHKTRCHNSSYGEDTIVSVL